MLSGGMMSDYCLIMYVVGFQQVSKYEYRALFHVIADSYTCVARVGRLRTGGAARRNIRQSSAISSLANPAPI